MIYLGDIRLPQRVNEAMQMQVEAERKKRAAILESEGIIMHLTCIQNVLKEQETYAQSNGFIDFANW